MYASQLVYLLLVVVYCYLTCYCVKSRGRDHREKPPLPTHNVADHVTVEQHFVRIVSVLARLRNGLRVPPLGALHHNQRLLGMQTLLNSDVLRRHRLAPVTFQRSVGRDIFANDAGGADTQVSPANIQIVVITEALRANGTFTFIVDMTPRVIATKRIVTERGGHQLLNLHVLGTLHLGPSIFWRSLCDTVRLGGNSQTFLDFPKDMTRGKLFMESLAESYLAGRLHHRH